MPIGNNNVKELLFFDGQFTKEIRESFVRHVESLNVPHIRIADLFGISLITLGNWMGGKVRHCSNEIARSRMIGFLRGNYDAMLKNGDYRILKEDDYISQEINGECKAVLSEKMVSVFTQISQIYDVLSQNEYMGEAYISLLDKSGLRLFNQYMRMVLDHEQKDSLLGDKMSVTVEYANNSADVGMVAESSDVEYECRKSNVTNDIPETVDSASDLYVDVDNKADVIDNCVFETIEASVLIDNNENQTQTSK